MIFRKLFIFDIFKRFCDFLYFICRWYEGSHPWSVNNNQGIEGLNKQIKKSHTFKRRCPLANFMDIVVRMIKEWSKQPDILSKSRTETLFNPKDGLKLRTDGYQWLKSNKTGSADRIICVKPDNKYTVSEEFGIGQVDNLWVVASSSNKMGGSLKERAKERIKMRGAPSFKSFEHYMEVRTSCWIVEERDGNFNCDCPKGMKGKQCWHEVGLQYKKGTLEVTSEVRSIPINQKRKRGRPKKLPYCLTRSPSAADPSSSNQVPDLPEQDHGDDLPADALQAEPPLRKTTKKRKRLQEASPEPQTPVAALLSQAKAVKPGLGASQPPKKKARSEAVAKDNQSKPQPKNQPKKTAHKPSADRPSKPKSVNCKKKVGSCRHEIVFAEHYDRKEWNVYADYVRVQKSSVEIDPEYLA